jgi:hypothetical protein
LGLGLGLGHFPGEKFRMLVFSFLKQIIEVLYSRNSAARHLSIILSPRFPAQSASRCPSLFTSRLNNFVCKINCGLGWSLTTLRSGREFFLIHSR